MTNKCSHGGSHHNLYCVDIVHGQIKLKLVICHSAVRLLSTMVATPLCGYFRQWLPLRCTASFDNGCHSAVRLLSTMVATPLYGYFRQWLPLHCTAIFDNGCHSAVRILSTMVATPLYGYFRQWLPLRCTATFDNGCHSAVRLLSTMVLLLPVVGLFSPPFVHLCLS